jgi:hypothetical protein
MAKATWIKVGGIWKNCVSIWRNVSGSWQPGIVPWIRAGGIWKDCFENLWDEPTYLRVDPGGFTINNLGMNLVNGTVSFNGATCWYGISSLLVQVVVYNWRNEQQGSPTVYFSGAYTANTDLGAMSNVVYGPPIPPTGYWMRLEFLESA